MILWPLRNRNILPFSSQTNGPFSLTLFTHTTTQIPVFTSVSFWMRAKHWCYYRLALVLTELPPGWQTNQHHPGLILSVLSTCSGVWLSEGVIFSLLCQNTEEKQFQESDYSQITLRTTQRRRANWDVETVKVVLLYRDGYSVILFMVAFLFFVFSLADSPGKTCDFSSVTRHHQSSPSIMCVNVNKSASQ